MDNKFSVIEKFKEYRLNMSEIAAICKLLTVHNIPLSVIRQTFSDVDFNSGDVDYILSSACELAKQKGFKI